MVEFNLRGGSSSATDLGSTRSLQTNDSTHSVLFCYFNRIVCLYLIHECDFCILSIINFTISILNILLLMFSYPDFHVSELSTDFCLWISVY